MNILNFRNKPVLFCSCFKGIVHPTKKILLTLIWNIYNELQWDSSFQASKRMEKNHNKNIIKVVQMTHVESEF